MNDHTENTVWLYVTIPKCIWEADINLLRFEIKARIKIVYHYVELFQAIFTKIKKCSGIVQSKLLKGIFCAFHDLLLKPQAFKMSELVNLSVLVFYTIEAMQEIKISCVCTNLSQNRIDKAM